MLPKEVELVCRHPGVSRLQCAGYHTDYCDDNDDDANINDDSDNADNDNYDDDDENYKIALMILITTSTILIKLVRLLTKKMMMTIVGVDNNTRTRMVPDKLNYFMLKKRTPPLHVNYCQRYTHTERASK